MVAPKRNSEMDTYTRLRPIHSESSRLDLDGAFSPNNRRASVRARALLPNPHERTPTRAIPADCSEQPCLIFLVLVQHLRAVTQPTRGYQRRSVGVVLQRHSYRALESMIESGGECRKYLRKGAGPGVKVKSLA